MNATEQANAAAGNLLGDAAPFAPVPYFWSDQYDTRIQAYGIFQPGVDLRIVYGHPVDGHLEVVSRGKFRELLVAGQGGSGHGQASALPVDADHVRDLETTSSPWQAHAA